MSDQAEDVAGVGGVAVKVEPVDGEAVPAGGEGGGQGGQGGAAQGGGAADTSEAAAQGDAAAGGGGGGEGGGGGGVGHAEAASSGDAVVKTEPGAAAPAAAPAAPAAAAPPAAEEIDLGGGAGEWAAPEGVPEPSLSQYTARAKDAHAKLQRNKHDIDAWKVPPPCIPQNSRPRSPPLPSSPPLLSEPLLCACLEHRHTSVLGNSASASTPGRRCTPLKSAARRS